MANDDKVAVVTGSTGGTREGILRRMAGDGLSFGVSGRRITKGEEIAQSSARVAAIVS